MALTPQQIRDLIHRTMAPTMRRAALAITRGVIRRVTDSARAQLVQLSLLGDGEDEEVADDVEHVQPFGVSFVPPVDSEVVALSVGGNRDYIVAVGASSREHRPTEVTVPFIEGGGGSIGRSVREGEGGLYSLDGWRVFLDDAGNVYLGGPPSVATLQVAEASRVEAELNKIRTHLAALAVTVPSGGGSNIPVTTTATPYTSVGAVGSPRVRVP